MNLNTSNRHIAFLLGAGFSAPMGMPTASMLGKNILSDIYHRITLSFCEGYGDMFHNFIFWKVLLGSESNGEFNYEQFFDNLNEEKRRSLDEDKLLSFIESGMIVNYRQWRIDSYKDFLYRSNTVLRLFEKLKCNQEEYSNCVETVMRNYQNMIAKYLLGSTANGKLANVPLCCKGFVDIISHFVKQGYTIDIYTLNHDLLLESLLSHANLKDYISDGFDDEIKLIVNKQYRCFNTHKFNKTIRIYKLHGSIDMHELSTMGGNSKQDYIKIVQGYSDNNAFLLDRQYSASILPLFLTGITSKETEYRNEPFKTLLKIFETNISKAEKLIVIGYGGKDTGINRILENNYPNWSKACVVSRHAEKHRFVLNNVAKAVNKGVENLKFEDLNL